MKAKKNIISKVLVLGGTGKTGSRVAQQLTEKGWPVRIGSRSGTPSFDWEDAGTWGSAVKDMDAVYLSFYPDVAVPGAVDKVAAFTKTAVDNGIKHIVLLSGRGEKEAQACEDIVMNAGIDWTVIRCAWFNQNFSEGYLLDPLMAGHVALPAGSVVEPFVDTEDIADVAVAAFTEEGHAGKLYELTGPRLITFPEAVAEIAKATGRNIQYQEITMEEYKGMLAEYEIPEDFIWLVSYLFTEVLDGRNTYLADGVQQALGRAPRDFSEYVKRTAASGIWNG
ncbi:NAD(P)H-binding protein [Chitinophaga sp. 22321]|uniref:NAD(P)H-binding protein n=1 Tax=Chitinophaga hostae TaxID=2831022 RepID=A0ABS5J759_9BACT|nr:NAD(P)H-binding protein [Chitinophaga hostae]MBS0031053.1 NAD(P)H-binding protein [Chitinophaga hostae]